MKTETRIPAASRQNRRADRSRAQEASQQLPLRAVVERIVTNPDYPHYQAERLECGHTLQKQSPAWRGNRYGTGGEWVWPKSRRCWKCGK